LVTSKGAIGMINLFGKITLRGKIWFLIKLACLTLVIAQTSVNIRNNFFSGKTITSTRVTKTDDIPLILNIIVKPGFDAKRLCKHGYDNVYRYFSGLVAKDGNCSRKAMDMGQIGKRSFLNICGAREAEPNYGSFLINQNFISILIGIN
jgi:hypothetical protein